MLPRGIFRKRRRPEEGVRRSPGIVRNPIDEVKAIQTLLADVYKDAGDGRTLIRELVQNADDARARRLTLTVLEDGWRDAANSLLQGPALLVANDGPFSATDRSAMHMAIGGAKEADVDKIGTFGIGLKSIFHICEAFLYIGAAQSDWQPNVVNPWYGTGQTRDKDPLNHDWDTVGGDDWKRLRVAVRHLLGETDTGLLLWIPLRLNEHNRGIRGRRFWLADNLPEPKQLVSWFANPTPAALLLAQCGYLHTIEARRAANPGDLGNSSTLMRVARQGEEWLGRYQDDGNGFIERRLLGTIESEELKWSVTGVESLGNNTLVGLRSDDNWPQSHNIWNGRYETVPRKALAHAAVTVLRPVAHDADALGMRLRWAAFLPLDDHPRPSSSAIVESRGSSPAWEIILHGYFWPSQDRRSIPGVTDRESDASDAGAIRETWNRTLCERLLLPLLPRALARAVDGVDEGAAQALLEQVQSYIDGKSCMPYVTRRHWLLPTVAQDRMQWRVVDAHTFEARRVLSIPNWGTAPEGVRTRFRASLEDTGDTAVIEDAAPRFSESLDEWTTRHVECLLDSVPADAFAAPENLRWITRVIKHALGSDGSPDDVRLGSFVRWLVRRIGEGALAPTVRRTILRPTRDELRREWRNMCSVFPTAWVVETPVDTRRAVVELTKCNGILGEGLFPLPVGRRSDGSGPNPTSPDQDCIDRALAALGRQLEDGGQSDELRESRLLLAEHLLSIRPEAPMDAALCTLPFLRATRLPDDGNEAWSISYLRRKRMKCRVFASGPTRGQAVNDLAAALGGPMWTVRGEAARAVGIDVPAPVTEALAAAVLTATVFSEAAARAPLVRRLVPTALSSVAARRAVRTLLVARPFALDDDDKELFQCRVGYDGDGGGGATQEHAMLILLHLIDQPWRAFASSLVASISQEALDCLSIRQVTPDALRRILDQCFRGQVDWAGLTLEETLCLIKRVPHTQPKDRARWRRMPLHRHANDDRGAFDDRALRKATTGPIAVPPELRSEIRVLDPDPEVADLYLHVRALDQDRILRRMLRARRPWRFATTILRHLNTDGGALRLSSDPALRRLSKESCWLPSRDGGGIAPEALLIAPEELLKAVRHLSTERAFGDKRLPGDVSPQIWRMAKSVVRELLGRMGRDRQVERLADALDPDRVRAVDDGAWLLISDSARVDGPLLECALGTPLVARHRGWRLVHAAAQTLSLRIGQSEHYSKSLLKLARALCGPVPPRCQVEMLSILSDEKPAKDSPAGRLFRTMLASFVDTNEFPNMVLPRLCLPTQDGQWRSIRDIAVSETGVARRHLPIPELRPILRIDKTGGRVQTPAASGGRVSMTGESLREYFEHWCRHVGRSAVGAFLSLLGKSLDPRVDVDGLAGEWLGTDISIAGVRSSLFDSASGTDPWASLRILVFPAIQHGRGVRAINVLGEEREMDASSDSETLFATDPLFYPERMYGKNPHFAYWEIRLRDVEPDSRSRDDLMRLLRGTVERWAIKCLKLDSGRVSEWWAKWGESSQADLSPVVASIRAHLPLTLRQLDVRRCPPLWSALRKAERAQRQREQDPSEGSISHERDQLDNLARLAEEPEHQRFLSMRVSKLIRHYGYREDSVLLELAQNADDALAEAAEINGGTLPREARCLRIQADLRNDAGEPTLSVMHWGRPINDTGGSAFLGGHDRQWDQDLYFMMLMNLSGKPGETPGEGSSAATTGRFGLGFKSVHLVSRHPTVISGFMAFSIAGGLLPVAKPLPINADAWKRGGRRATRVELPMRQDKDAGHLLGLLFRRFAYARVLLPVFARQVREVVVEGGPSPGVHAFDKETVKDAPEWSVGAATDFPNHPGSWQILRFRPADAGPKDTGTAAVAVGLRNELPAALPAGVPFLWNVTPTSEEWDCGYVVNGPFKLDPGRTHASLDGNTTLEVARRLGKELGEGLIALHDALVDAPQRHHPALSGGDPWSFLSSLWTVLASGTDTPDRLRSSLLRHLHGPGRGISAWMDARSVVPTNLPAPFRSHLPPLGPGVAWEVAVDGLDSPELCATLNDVDDEDFRSLVRDGRIVADDIDQTLRSLHRLSGADTGLTVTGQVSPTSLFERLAERWDGLLTPAQLHALRPLSRTAVWSVFFKDSGGEPLGRSLHAESVKGDIRPLAELLVRSSSDHVELDDDALLAAFAPTASVLDPEYIGQAEDRTTFLWLRGPHRVDAANIADWCRNAVEARRLSALRYLLHGRLRDSVIGHITSSGTGSSWLDDYHAVNKVLKGVGEEQWRHVGHLATLFPDRFQSGGDDPPKEPASGTATAFFRCLSEWWDVAAVRDEVIAAYERRAWPAWLRDSGLAGGLAAGSEDHWMALLVLGACRSLGRTRNFQHRGFLEVVHERGWWDVFKNPVDEQAWMRILRDWHDDESDNLPHQQGMSLFPAIYQLSRYRDVYVRLLRSAGQRPPADYRIDRLLNPRSDPAATGAGTHFDAPPAPLDMGRHWILRELVRLGVIEGEHLYPDCWVPSEQVLRFLHRFGLEMPGESVSNRDAARAIFDFLATELDTETPDLHRAFDIPIRHVASNGEVRRRLGLEE